jgi:xanthine dehydrogenase YagT iron-sulfur-binding subunit
MEKKKSHFAVTRRGFLGTLGAGAVAVVATGGLATGAAKESLAIDPQEMTKVKLRINGKMHRVLVEPRWSLLFVLREVIGLTAAKEGCGRGECGACTVLIDNVPRYACLTLAVEAEGAEIVTPEGLMAGEMLGPVQQAFLEHDAFQCGYCTSGHVMAVEGLLRARPDPSMDEIRTGVSGNLCRCGAYTHIFEAAKRAARLKGGQR